jgi:hypothetical protein
MESVNALIDDFARRPVYRACHVYSTSPLPDSLFDKIRQSGAKPFIKCLKELNLDFVGTFI